MKYLCLAYEEEDRLRRQFVFPNPLSYIPSSVRVMALHQAIWPLLEPVPGVPPTTCRPCQNA